MVPPWQHYDEPTHFEYAALIRELGRVPSLDEQIPALRREIAASMVRAGFFQSPELPLTAPNLEDRELSLGINERGHPPLYYALVALGTLPFADMPIEAQLRAARSIGVVLAALLFLGAYLLLRLLLGEQWQLRCAILAALALQPAFADNLSSVNSDVLANVVAVLLLLVGVAILRKPSWALALASVLMLLLAWNVKRTLLVYSLVVPIAWLLVAPQLFRRILTITAGCVASAGLVWLLFSPWQLADWRGTQPALESRGDGMQPGQHSFVLHPGETLVQTVYPYRLKNTGARTLTFGAWMRADHPAVSPSLLVIVDGVPSGGVAMLDTTWRLVTATAELASDRSSVELQLLGTPDTTLYADSLALVVDDTPLPGDDTPDGSYEPGILGSMSQPNLVRNASAERRVPVLPAPVRQLAGRVFGESGLAQTLSSLFNPRWILAVYPQQLWLLFVGSWGIFGWGQYSVSPGWFTPLAILVVVSLVGAARLLLGLTAENRRPRAVDESNDPAVAGRRLSQQWWLCAFAVALGWGVALLRVHNQPFPGSMFWSFGRYTFVAMLPGLAIFVAGFRAALPPVLRDQGMAAQLVFLLVFAGIAASVFLLPQ